MSCAWVNRAIIPYQTILGFHDLEREALKPFENIVKKGENAGTQRFILFQQRFLNKKKILIKVH